MIAATVMADPPSLPRTTTDGAGGARLPEFGGKFAVSGCTTAGYSAKRLPYLALKIRPGGGYRQRFYAMQVAGEIGVQSIG